MRAAFDLPQALFIGIAEKGGFTHATISRQATEEPAVVELPVSPAPANASWA